MMKNQDIIRINILKKPSRNNKINWIKTKDRAVRMKSKKIMRMHRWFRIIRMGSVIYSTNLTA